MSVKVGDRVRIIGDCVGHGIPEGIEVEVKDVWSYGSTQAEYKGAMRMVNGKDYVKVENTLELIANLSAEVARLSKRVATLEATQNVPVKSIKERYEAHKQARKNREEIVAKAKADVEELRSYRNEAVQMRKPLYVVNDTFVTTPDFIVNREKRTVVVLLRWFDKVVAKGIAKASPEDCFNVHIGKAIALRRALGLEVPDEYLNAPQPTNVKVGDIVTWKYVECEYKVLSTVKSRNNLMIVVDYNDGEYVGETAHASDFTDAKVIDDSDRK